MNDEIVAIYCLCDDILRAMNYKGDRQQQMSDAEVMTTAIVAVLYFGGNFGTGSAPWGKALQPSWYLDLDNLALK